MIKGVFFDLYDTLIITGEKTASGWISEFYTCLREYGLSISKEEFTDRCHGFFSSAEPVRRNDGLTVYERRIKALCTGLGIEIDAVTTGGASDASFAAALGRAVLDGLGPVGGAAHSPDEYILHSSIAKRGCLLALLMAACIDAP